MAPLPRRLHFVVGTSLLGASLASGCAKPKIVNEGPNEPVHVNEGPVEADEGPAVDEPEVPPQAADADEPKPSEAVMVNTRPPDSP